MCNLVTGDSCTLEPMASLHEIKAVQDHDSCYLVLRSVLDGALETIEEQQQKIDRLESQLNHIYTHYTVPEQG